MDEENKLPLKRVELSLSKFNEVAIPHHLDLLRQHKTNITKYEEAGQYARMRTEQAHARRVASQLRSLLGELEALRRQVRSQDVASFDRLTQRSRDLTLRAIMDYLDSSPTSESPAASSVTSMDSVGVVGEAGGELVQLQVDSRALALAEREAALRGWAALQAELRALHDAWQHVQAAALAHREHVARAAAGADVAGAQVAAARAHLGAAERLRAGAYGAGGALAGALLGGPVGLVLGAKAGAAALLLGSAVGYAGARLLGRRRARQLDDATDAAPDGDDDKKKC